MTGMEILAGYLAACWRWSEAHLADLFDRLLWGLICLWLAGLGVLALVSLAMWCC